MMCGLAKPTGGTAKIMGIDILENPSKARSKPGLHGAEVLFVR